MVAIIVVGAGEKAVEVVVSGLVVVFFFFFFGILCGCVGDLESANQSSLVNLKNNNDLEPLQHDT